MKSKLTVNDIARMMDLSAVKTKHTLSDVKLVAAEAKRLNCIVAYALPAYIPVLHELLADAPEVITGGPVGFPAGANSTAIKVAETREMIAAGAGELDMVANIGMLRSEKYVYVADEIRAIVDAAEGVPLKVIIEAHYLTDDQIKKASELIVTAGAQWVKTGTGWAPTGATLHNITLIKKTVGDAAEVKASGNVRDLETLVEMYRRGATRFGVNINSGVAILEQCASLDGGSVAVGDPLC